MGLGGEFKNNKKNVIQHTAEKSDWHALITTPWEARQAIDNLVQRCLTDKNGNRIPDIMLETKIDMLYRYAQQCGEISDPMTFKQWLTSGKKK
ncbi:MAG: hypothetical protein WKF87_06685 [Chryseolinea sp.]